MSHLTKNDVKRVANLARLNIPETEIPKFTSQLEEIVGFVSQLNEVDVKGIEPTSQTTGLENVTRPDEIKEIGRITKDEALSGTDKIHNDYFKVPAILAERSDK